MQAGQIDISISKSAMEYIAAMQRARPGHRFRLSIKKTGCSGFAYDPSLIEKIYPNDVPIPLDEFTLYLDPEWAHLMQGLQIDYVEENKGGLKQKRLVFTNPNESARCGCGESFHIE